MYELLLEGMEMSVSLGDRTLFTIPRLTVYAGDRIGLIGQNGCGKSTLLQVLAGCRPCDGGQIRRGCDLGYAPQFGLGAGESTGESRRNFGVGKLEDRAACSGGEITRMRLSRIPFGARLLLLDEPTANLDLPGCRLLEEKLRQQETFVLVSHDRELLDRLCNRIWYLEGGGLRCYDGNYTAFEQAQELEKLTQTRAREQYLREKRHLEEAAQELRAQSAQVRKAPRRMGNSEARLHKMGDQKGKKTIDRQRKALQSRLEKLEKVEQVREIPPMQLDFSLTHPPRSKTVLQVKKLHFGYPHTPDLLKEISFTLENGDKMALMGRNGSGKSTLLGLIAQGYAGIQCSPQARLGFLNQDLSTLLPQHTVLENARLRAVQREDVVRTVLNRMLLPKTCWDKQAGLLSGGEKMKLCLCQLILSDCNVLVLDEPTNYLDLPSLRALERMLGEYPGTVLLVSHDQAFVRHTATRLLFLQEGRAQVFNGTLDAWEEEKRASPQADAALRRSALQMRMTELIGRISAAAPGEKAQLEQAYDACLAEYRALR